MKDFGPTPLLMASAGIDAGAGTGDMAPVVDTTSSDAIDTTGTGTDDTTGAEPDATGTPGDTTGEPFKGRAIENGKINPAAKSVLEEIRAKSPALEKQIRNALIRQDVFAREFPGGVQAVRARIGQLESQIQELGGADGVKEIKGQLDFFQDLDSQFTAGDPRFVEALVASPEGQAAFLKIAPAMIEKYASMHPEGFDAYIAGKMKAEFEGAGFKSALSEMRFFLDRMPDSPEKNEVLQRWADIVGDNEGKTGLFNRVMARAAKQVATPKLEGAQPKTDDTERQQLEQERAQIKNEKFSTAWTSELNSVIAPELSRLRTERGFDDTKKGAIAELFKSNMDRIVREKGQQISKFFKAGDIQAYRNAARSLFRQEAPKALLAAVDMVAPKNGKPRTAALGVTKPAQTSANGAPVKAPVAEAGWTSLRTKPGLDQVDFDKTRALGPNAWGEGKAVLKDGKRVKFPR
jgi:hypothetical protein